MQLAEHMFNATIFANGSVALNAAVQWLGSHGDDDCEFDIRRRHAGFIVEVYTAMPRDFRGYVHDQDAPR